MNRYAMTRGDRLNHSWAILPAARCLFNKNKVTLTEIAEFWNEGTVVVCRKPNGQFHFIAGASGSYSKLGRLQSVHHDQTFASMGDWEVVNEVNYKMVDGVPEFTYAAEPIFTKGPTQNMVPSAAMAVFK